MNKIIIVALVLPYNLTVGVYIFEILLVTVVKHCLEKAHNPRAYSSLQSSNKKELGVYVVFSAADFN